ncbi:MAG: hypothetical protein KHX56_06300 [Clostridiales bacterium]|nr:hypothetical protein [Clostridiales bacterium]
MGTYKTKTTITDFGPYVTALILNTGGDVSLKDIHPEDFLVYVERKNKNTGTVLKTKEFFQWNEAPKPARGTRKVLRAYPCDSEGNYCDPGQWIALEMGTDALGKTIDGADFSQNDYKITYVKNSGLFKCGQAFCENSGDICPQLEGWENGQSHSGKYALKYGYYTPGAVRAASKGRALPLVIWLHGAGEGGMEPTIAYTGNKAVNFSSKEIQEKLGGAAWVLVPQCPTVWMDDGIEQLGRTNESIYTLSLKACIDEFIQKHKEFVDLSRIYLGGCSNGGFMTVRMAICYPGFFAAIFPVCEAFFEENLTPEYIQRLKNTPCWLVHAKGDGLVDPKQTALPLYKKLKAAGAGNVHLTYFDNMDNESRQFWKDEKLTPHAFDHGVWVRVYNDACKNDFDGGPVLWKGKAVTLFEWLGSQKNFK